MDAIDGDRFTLAGLARAIRTRKISPVEITRVCLERIERLDPRLNAFITVTADRALADARRAEREIGRGRWRGPLHGVPVAIKDIFATRGIRTTCGSRVLRDWVPDHDATVVQRLAHAGSVLLGKLNMSEFAYAGVHPDVGPPRNPWNLDRFTGGSSSGSGAAVAAGLCFASMGTDTGGSIRGPAAHCGIVGLKPTYGLVSRAGVVPLSWSLDHAGPMARTSEDAAIVLEAVQGFDAADPTSANRGAARGRERSLPAVARGARRWRVGVLREFLGGTTQPDIASCVGAAVEALGRLVRGVEDVTLPHAAEIVPAWTTICVAEATALPCAHARAATGRLRRTRPRPAAGRPRRASSGIPAGAARPADGHRRDGGAVRARRSAGAAVHAHGSADDRGSDVHPWVVGRPDGSHPVDRPRQPCGDARGLRAVRVYDIRAAGRAADHRAALRRLDGPRGRARVRAAHRVDEAAAVARRHRRAGGHLAAPMRRSAACAAWRPVSAAPFMYPWCSRLQCSPAKSRFPTRRPSAPRIPVHCPGR